MLIIPVLLSLAAAPAVPEWIKQRPITWNAEREQLTLAYRKERFAEEKPTLDITPTMVVIHHTAIDSLEQSFKTFDPPTLSANRADIAGASPLNVSAHFLVDQDGTVYQLMPATRMARHTIGLNWTALAIENVGGSRKKLTHAQLEADVKLVRYLKETFPTLTLLIGHHEYQALRTSALWHERDALYSTPKSDPGIPFMAELRKRVADLGLARLPPDVGPKVDFSNGSTRRYERAEVQGKSLRELSLLRNELYARHGRTFHKPYLIAYFGKLQWYRANPGYSADLLTENDLANLKLIEAEENAIDPAALRLRRNTVFARHGRKFESADLAEYFAKQPWYRPDAAYKDEVLTADDKFEIELVQEFEKRAAAVPTYAEWKPGRKIDPAALVGAAPWGLIAFYVRATAELKVAMVGAPCEKDGSVQPNPPGFTDIDLPSFCATWAKSRPLSDLPAVDQATLLEVERARALAMVEKRHGPNCGDECGQQFGTYVGMSEQEERATANSYRACEKECAKTFKARLKQFQTEKAEALARIKGGDFPRGWEAVDTGPPVSAA